MTIITTKKEEKKPLLNEHAPPTKLIYFIKDPKHQWKHNDSSYMIVQALPHKEIHEVEPELFQEGGVVV